VPSSSTAIFRPGSSAFTARPILSVMPRAANSVVSARDMSAEAGIGLDSGSTRLISHAPRTPRAARYSSSSSAHSLGAGGHLKGAADTPTMAWPRENVGSTSRRRNAPATE